nr:hypothetical protein [Tanacetum cinerariifolium]
MGIYVDSNKVKHAAAKIGCLVLKTPFNYLGYRVGDLMFRIKSWHDVTEGMHTRHDLDIPYVHFLSSYEGALKYVIYLYTFFNGADVNSKKPSWVRWKSVLAAKDVGGLGVSSLFALNRALMFKWVWRFFSQNNSLWVRIVKALHGEDGKIDKKFQPRYSSSWLNIINEIESLKLHVPRLYALESMKNIEVASKLSHEGLEFSFRCNPRGGVEQAQFERLKEMVEGVTLREINRYMLQNLDLAEEETRVTSLPLEEPLKTFTLQTLRLSSISDKRIAAILEAAREKVIDSINNRDKMIQTYQAI